MVTPRAEARPRASNRQIWISLPLSLLFLPVVIGVAGKTAATARPAVLLTIFATVITTASLTRPAWAGRHSAGILIVGARSLRSILRAILFAVNWLLIAAVLIFASLILVPKLVPYVYLGVVTHAAVATAMHVLTARVPSRAIRHRRVKSVVRLTGNVAPGDGWVHVIKAIESAQDAREQPLLLDVVDREGSAVMSSSPESCIGPCEIRIRDADWLVPFFGFRYIHYLIDLGANEETGAEIELEDLCTVIREGRPRDFLRLASGRVVEQKELT